MNYGLSLDDFVEEVFQHDWSDVGPGGHYIVFNGGNKEEAVNKMAEAIKSLLRRMVYESDGYGYEVEK